MNRKLMTIRTLPRTAGALLALMVTCGSAAATESPITVDETVRWQQQEEARRLMEGRERMQQEALQGQEAANRRLEEAQRRLEASSREVAELSRELGRSTIITYGVGYGTNGPVATNGPVVINGPNGAYGASSVALAMPRSQLGISVVTDERRDGALVGQVSPGGAAAEAGIRPGDLIVSLGGEDLTRDSNPGRALIEKMQQVKPESKVQVGVLRDGKRMNFDVTARAMAPPMLRTEQVRQYRDVGDAVRGSVRAVGPESGAMRMESLSGLVALADGNRLGGMEFATLSEQLGSYFGVKSGVLVVRAGADAPFGLKDGDVILSVDGRTPTNAQHAGRILRSYQPGEKVKLRVQRDRKAVDVNAAAPGEPRAPAGP